MNNPLVHAFFVGRAVAEVLYEQLESGITQTLSDLGKFDAEQRENIRQFVDQVIERANLEEELAMQERPAPAAGGSAATTDLQETIDELRAEIAQLRSELQRYRSRSV